MPSALGVFNHASGHAGGVPKATLERGRSVEFPSEGNRYFLVDTKRLICSNKSCIRSIAGCADLNLAGLCWVSCRKFSDLVMMIFSGQSVISRVYTSRFGNGADRLAPLPRWY